MDEKRLTIPAADGTVHVFEKGNVTWFEVHEGADPSYPGQPAVALIRHALQQQATIDAQAERIRVLELALRYISCTCGDGYDPNCPSHGVTV